MVGQTISHYRITEKIGEGGMGVVYKARDTRLDRVVAIKALPPDRITDAQARERFEREAQTISSLNHPNICTLHDIVSHNGADYLVMEYVEGKPLKGPLALKEVLRLGTQIADALDHAHRNSVIHRDLKPGNILVSKSGVKLLDFGLAKLIRRDPEVEVTKTAGITKEGTILGTYHYMAPEQWEGQEADTRSDIFAFGAVLYEMVTGRKAFDGETPASVIAAILERNPPTLSTIEPMSPPALDHVVKRSLEKNPNRRWQAAADLRLELEWIAESVEQATSLASRPTSIYRRVLPWAVAALMALAAGLSLWTSRRAAPATNPPVTKVIATLPEGQAIRVGARATSVAMSRDGTKMVFAGQSGNTTQLYQRSMSELGARPIPGTEGADTPFFSPDGRWVGFIAEGEIRKVSLAGGPPLAIRGVQGILGAHWGDDDTIVFGRSQQRGIWRVPASGGVPERVTTPDAEQGELFHRCPEMLPGGKAVLYVASGGSIDRGRIILHPLATGERQLLIDRGSNPRYAPTGHLVYSHEGSLLAAPFDLRELKLTGDPVPVLEGLWMQVSYASFGFSDNGLLVYVPGGLQSGENTLVWVDHEGQEQPVTEIRRRFRGPRLSPDGKKLAVWIGGDDPHVWTLDLPRGILTRLTSEGRNFWPLWSPDGRRVAFPTLVPGGAVNLFWMPADGSGPAERLTESEYRQQPLSWSRDGKHLVFHQSGDPDTGWDIWVLPMDGDRKPWPFVNTPANECQPALSPDSRWLAYVSSESGVDEVYIKAFPGPGGRWQVSTDGGTEPLWGPDGRELFYRHGEEMMVVDITRERRFSPSGPRVLFTGPYVPASTSGRNSDVASDGRRFVMVKEADRERTVSQYVVRTNWFQELERLAPAGE